MNPECLDCVRSVLRSCMCCCLDTHGNSKELAFLWNTKAFCQNHVALSHNTAQQCSPQASTPSGPPHPLSLHVPPDACRYIGPIRCTSCYKHTSCHNNHCRKQPHQLISSHNSSQAATKEVTLRIEYILFGRLALQPAGLTTATLSPTYLLMWLAASKAVQLPSSTTPLSRTTPCCRLSQSVHIQPSICVLVAP
jgi:hypothetical protein